MNQNIEWYKSIKFCLTILRYSFSKVKRNNASEANASFFHLSAFKRVDTLEIIYQHRTKYINY